MTQQMIEAQRQTQQEVSNSYKGVLQGQIMQHEMARAQSLNEK